jgi:hypothetical protein
MVVDSELVGMSIPARYFAYAEAYGDGAISITEKMISDESQSTWVNSAVVLMLSAHAVELFLKGALFKSDPTAKINHHNIEELYSLYCETYRKTEFEFYMPFKTEYPGMSEAEIESLKECKSPKPSVLYRYPTANGNTKWEGAFGFQASSFLQTLRQLKSDFSRLSKCFI